MKRNAVPLLLVLALAIGGWFAYMENRHASFTLVPAQLTAEEILEELPELAITEADEALQQAVLAMPEMQRGLERTSIQELSLSAARAALDEFLPADYTQIFELSVTRGTTVYLSVRHGPTKRTSWSFFDGTISKNIGLYGAAGEPAPEVKAIYSNDLNGIQKLTSKRLWFSWLTNEGRS